jgi:hypothetical protein
MDRKSRHKIAQSEKLLSAALQERDERLKKLLREAPTHARRHATAVAAIVLSGQPRIYEPLSRAWARALRQYGIGDNDQHEAAQELYPTIIGDREESSRFTEIFRRAPVWLLQFTGMALDARFLKFELPNISKKLRWGSSGFDDSRRWPLLPLGTISAGDPIPDLDPRWFFIIVCCMITEPLPSLEDLSRQHEKERSCGGKRELELFEFAVQSEIKADSEWSDYEKRRVRKLCDWIVRSRAMRT